MLQEGTSVDIDPENGAEHRNNWTASKLAISFRTRVIGALTQFHINGDISMSMHTMIN